ncbi:Uncharacterized protein APZ42_003057, partial [Daphnia magna]
PVCHGRFPPTHHHRAPDARHGRSRGRHHRAGGAVFGPVGRRSGHPESGGQSAGFGHWHRAGAGHGARIPPNQHHHPGGADGLRQSGGALRPKA